MGNSQLMVERERAATVVVTSAVLWSPFVRPTSRSHGSPALAASEHA